MGGEKSFCYHPPMLNALLTALVLAGSPGTTATTSATVASPATARTLTFTYKVVVDAPPADSGAVDVFVPLAQDDGQQKVLRREITASIPGVEGTDKTYGNKFWHGHLDTSDGKPIEVVVNYTIERSAWTVDPKGKGSKAEKEKALKVFLRPDLKAPTSGELVDKVRADLPKAEKGKADPLARARVLYDYVIDNMEYKKTGTGWGNGDLGWACTEKYGNCTDFHALFTSLARAEGIPARFEIGFPIPEDKKESEIPGYHCWVKFHAPKIGWFPIDASEADKNPAKRDLYFGTQPADRITFTVGRDLELGAGHTAGPLNYFVHPYVEVGGKPYTTMTKTYSFKEVAPQPKDG